jgi:hypothetical protein
VLVDVYRPGGDSFGLSSALAPQEVLLLALPRRPLLVDLKQRHGEGQHRSRGGYRGRYSRYPFNARGALDHLSSLKVVVARKAQGW